LLVLAGAGVEAIVIACNTAHHWYDELVRASAVPILHIADAACASVAPGACVGLLGTEAALQAGIYQERLARLGRPHLDQCARITPAAPFLPATCAGQARPLGRGGAAARTAIEDLLSQAAARTVVSRLHRIAGGARCHQFILS